MRTPVVRCPTCDKLVEWKAESRWRPFCCERCKMIDLGAWAAEDYKMPAQEQDATYRLDREV